MTLPARFKQDDVYRAAKGAAKAGIMVDRIEISFDNRIIVHARRDGVQPTGSNEWDEVLPT